MKWDGYVARSLMKIGYRRKEIRKIIAVTSVRKEWELDRRSDSNNDVINYMMYENIF